VRNVPQFSLQLIDVSFYEYGDFNENISHGAFIYYFASLKEKNALEFIEFRKRYCLNKDLNRQ